jgi:hypothetical protein
MPVTADMTATFDSVLALVDTAESMNRLVRVASLRMMCKRDDQKSDVPLLKASVGLEVIYDPAPAAGSGGWGGPHSQNMANGGRAKEGF